MKKRNNGRGTSGVPTRQARDNAKRAEVLPSSALEHSCYYMRRTCNDAS